MISVRRSMRAPNERLLGEPRNPLVPEPHTVVKLRWDSREGCHGTVAQVARQQTGARAPRSPHQPALGWRRTDETPAIRLSSGDSLDDHGDALADTDAHGRQAEGDV